MEKIKIAIADDHLVFRQGLVSLFTNHFSEISVLFHVSNGQELIDKLSGSVPDVILLDIDMPVMSGKEALHKILATYPAIKVIMLSFHFEPLFVTEYIGYGAAAYLPKECGILPIITAINAVHLKGYYYENISHILVNAKTSVLQDQFGLTKREAEILNLIREDKSDEEISAILFISTRTVEWHRSNLLHKTDSKNSKDLIEWGNRIAIHSHQSR